MDRQEALKSLDELKNHMLSEIQEKYKPCTETNINCIMAGAKKHLEIIYDKKMCVDSDFVSVEKYCENDDYIFHIEGVQRHIGVCEEIIQNFNNFS